MFCQRQLVIALVAILLFASTVMPALGESLMGTPVHPLLGWTLDADGSLYILDATHTLWQLAPDTLAPLRASRPLVPAVGSPSPLPLFPQDDWARSRVKLVADDTQLFLSGGVFTQTLVLDKKSSAPVAVVDKSGPLAVTANGQLFIVDAAPEVTGRVNEAVWAYELADLMLSPAAVITSTMWGGPIGVMALPGSDCLYVQSLGTPGTSPRDSTAIDVYLTEPFTLTASLYDPYPPFYFLSRPAFAPEGERIFATARANDASVSTYLLAFDFDGAFLQGMEHLDGLPATDSAGKWLYLLRQHGLWVLRGDDLALVSILPFTAGPPADLLLSADGNTLYLLGNGWLTALSTGTLHALGIPPVVPLPDVWERPIRYAPRNPGAGDVQFAQFDSEIYRSDDGGMTWTCLPAFTYPDDAHVQALSISPDYPTDHTLIALAGYSAPLHRSTDGGATLEEWTSRIAFTSDRGGNRDIYTMNPDGSDARRVTDGPGNDELPAWSPACTRIAFQSDRNGNWDIYSARADCDPGGPDAAKRCDLKRLTDDRTDDMLPAWSPDGHYIAFVSTRDGNPEIYVMGSDGSDARRLTFNDGGDWRPAWLPDGEHLVFTSDRSGNNDLYVICAPNPANSPPTSESCVVQITSDPSDERDPTTGISTTALFVSDREGFSRVYRIDLNYGMISAYAKADVPESHPALSATGSHLYVTREENSVTDIYRVENGQYTRLTAGDGFNGHPAGGPVWWEPELEVEAKH